MGLKFLHSVKPKLHTILDFLSATGFKFLMLFKLDSSPL